MKKTLATATAVITGLLGVTLPATSATGAAPKCTVNAFTELREATAKTTATITPKDDRRIHHFVFVYSEMPVQEMRKARGRTTAIAFAAPIHVIAFRNGILCKTGSNVGIG